MRPHNGAVEHLHQVRGLAGFGQQLEERLEHAGPTEPPEPLLHAVPVAILPRQGAPRQIVDRNKVGRFEELAVIMAWLSAAGLHRVKHFQHDPPIVLCHPRQHGRFPCCRSSIDSMNSRFENPLRDTFRYPSTWPNRQQLRVLTVVDDFTRECVGIVAVTQHFPTFENTRRHLCLKVGL